MPAASLPSCQVHEATASTVLAPKVHKRISSCKFPHAIAVPEMMLEAASALAAEERHQCPMYVSKVYLPQSQPHHQMI